MKSKLNTLLSLLLIFAFLVSTMSVFAFADEGEPGGEPTESGEEEVGTVDRLDLLLYRTFDEGWPTANGLTLSGAGSGEAKIENEENIDLTKNYFTRFYSYDGNDKYWNMAANTVIMNDGCTVFEFDVNLDDYLNDDGRKRQLSYAMGNGTNRVYSLDENGEYPLDENGDPIPSGTKDRPSYSLLYVTPNSDGTYKLEYGGVQTSATVFQNVPICTVQSGWTHLCYVLDFDTCPTTMTVNYTLADGTSGSTGPISTGLDGYYESVRVGFPNNGNSKNATYCMDNIKLYNIHGTSKEPQDLSSYLEAGNYGSLVNASMAKTITIEKGGGQITSEDTALDTAYMMKIGVNYALSANERKAIFTDENGEAYGAPFKDGEGTIWMPLLPILNCFNLEVYQHGTSYDIYNGTGATSLYAGVASATVNGERVGLLHAPVYMEKGEEGYLIIDMNDFETLFPGLYVTFDNMGLIIISVIDEVLTRETGMLKMVELMKLFIFDFPTGDQVYNDVKETTGLQHPYLFTNQDQFDYLYDLTKKWNAYNGTYADFLDTLDEYDHALFEPAYWYAHNTADSYISSYFTYDAKTKTYSMKNTAFFNKYYGWKNYDEYGDESKYNAEDDSGGYDPDGGRLNDSATYGTVIMMLSYAYQVTREQKYLDCAYMAMCRMAEWPHWGHEHFLNAADCTGPYSTGYDWIYNALHGDNALGKIYDCTNIEKAIYKNGIYQGYLTCIGQNKSTDRAQGNASHYHDRTGNWNAVCSCGMVVGSLCLMGTDYFNQNEDVKENTLYLVGDNLRYLPTIGLGEYAPDGAYIESPNYWDYGTNSLFRMCFALEKAAGRSYGLMDTWGIDTTCYFVLYISDNFELYWPYHDSGCTDSSSNWTGTFASSINQALFFFVADYFDDIQLANYRFNSVKNDGMDQVYDVFGYMNWMDYWKANEGDRTVELPLDRYMEGISGMTFRSSWEEGAIYTGLMGGWNKAEHGDRDSGNFIYEYGGIVWFNDLGSENYNVELFYSNSNGKSYLYRKNAEGQNVICLTTTATNGKTTYSTVVGGQLLNGDGKVIANKTTEYGGYVVIDNTSVYGTDICASATRGLLFTNDRSTVVIQDELNFNTPQESVWIGHVPLIAAKGSMPASSIVISDDGRTAYLRNPYSYTYDEEKGAYNEIIRVSIVSETLDYKFKITDCYTYYLTDTISSDDRYQYGSYGFDGNFEYPREKYQRLVVELPATMSVQLAVVIEHLDPDVASTQGVAYTYTPFADWEPVKETDVEHGQETEQRPIRSNVVTYSKIAKNYLNEGTAFSTDFIAFYRALVTVETALKYHSPSSFTGSILNSYEDYVAIGEIYEAYRNSIQKTSDTVNSIATNMIGLS